MTQTRVADPPIRRWTRARLTTVEATALAAAFALSVAGFHQRALLIMVLALGAIVLVAATCYRPVVGARVLVVAVPLLTGIPRGLAGPFRLSELVLLLVLGGVGLAWLLGADLGFTLQRADVAIALLSVCGVAVPLLFAFGRNRGPTIDDILAASLLIKGGLTYVIFRAVHRSLRDARVTAYVSLTVAAALAVFAGFDAFNVGGVADVLYRWMPSGANAEAINDHRASATFGSAAGFGGYLVAHLVLTVALLYKLPGRSRMHTRLIGVAAVIFVGVFLTGQISIWMAGVAVFVTLAVFERHRLTARTGIAFVGVAFVVVLIFFPVLERRLDGFRGQAIPTSELREIAAIAPRQAQPEALYQRDPGSSWDVRWFNLTTYFLPSLREPANLVLGVRPFAQVEAPESWRDWVWIESGVVWIVYVGGLPLLVSYTFFLSAFFRMVSPIRGGRVDALASIGPLAVPAFAVLMLFDPHLTLRGSSDGFYAVLALGAVGSSFFDAANHDLVPTNGESR